MDWGLSWVPRYSSTFRGYGGAVRVNGMHAWA